jgi:hypothetical protein
VVPGLGQQHSQGSPDPARSDDCDVEGRTRVYRRCVLGDVPVLGAPDDGKYRSADEAERQESFTAWRPTVGTQTWTTVPPPGLLLTRDQPPASSARSRMASIPR